MVNIKEVTVKLLEVEVQLGVEENENENENGAASPWGKLQFSEFQFSKFKMTKSLDFEKSITKIHLKIE